MTELAEFYAARLDERERIALAAGGGHWQSGCGQATHDACGKMKVLHMSASPSDLRAGDCEKIYGPDITIYAEGGHTPAQAAHITLNDPAQALREVEAGRKILAEHRQGDNDSIWCWRCDPDSDVDSSPACYPCLTLRAAASAFSGHPAYREEWKP